MIYLIDDKRSRQLDYGWNEQLFQKYSDFITPLYLYEEIKKVSSEKILSKNNIVLFHESFFDSVDNKHKNDGVDIRKSLNKLSNENKGFMLSFFSGSKNSRKLDNNVAYLPVSSLYQNLEVFIQKTQEGQKDFRYLLFGEKPNIESELLNKLLNANDLLEDSNHVVSSANFIAKSLENEIDDVFGSEDNGTFFLDEKYDSSINDEYLNDKVLEWFTTKEYDSIFIPLCFGNSLSDFNGLRFAAHIRCTDTPNQLKNIFLYSFIGDNTMLFENEYFDVLKTKNIQLIDYKKSAFKEAVDQKTKKILKEELPLEISKIRLDPPKNYEDSHSIANEWAIYRWARTINTSDNNIDKIENRIDSNLYFKYLQTIYPISKSRTINTDELKINYSGKPKILYIDDEAEKGWEEIFSYILGDINDLHFEVLDINYKETNQENLIEKTIVKIKEEDIDLVILDFRLLPEDFQVKDISEVSGLKLLKAIKKINPGIQVIIFSATNKVWNFEALQHAGSDSFVLKELPENSIDENLSSRLINSFLINTETGLKRRFLKEVFLKLAVISKNLDTLEYEDDTDYSLFILHLKSQIKLVLKAANKISLIDSSTIDIVFLNCYNFLELFKNYYLRELDYNFILGIEEIEMNRYKFFQGEVINEGQFNRINRNDNPSWFQTLTGILIDYFSVSKNDDREIINLNKIKDKRNYYIHGKKQSFDQNELLMIIDLMIIITKKMKE
ncbi:response regulator [Olleya sp. AS48]|uniref:response regulator n=1 Tax=Olleya sp. AS48 TaxID=3135774 RepID=UPI0031824B36